MPRARKLITSDVDERDREFITGERTAEGFYRLKPGTGLAHCIKRGLAFARYADLLWWETSTPEPRRCARVRRGDAPRVPRQDCSPTIARRRSTGGPISTQATIAKFQRELGAMGYKFQFVTLAGFHSLNHGMFELARGYRERGMAAYSELQEAEFASEANGYTATRHQREVGTGYFDLVNVDDQRRHASTTAMSESTEHAQFDRPALSVAAE